MIVSNTRSNLYKISKIRNLFLYVHISNGGL